MSLIARPFPHGRQKQASTLPQQEATSVNIVDNEGDGGGVQIALPQRHDAIGCQPRHLTAAAVVVSRRESRPFRVS
jgi:hypothetical protein